MKILINNQNSVLGRLFLLVFLLTVSLSSKADDYLETASNYTVMLWGNDKLQIKLPTQNDITGAFNRGVTDGRVYVTIDSGERQLLFWWDCNTHYSDLTAGKVFHVNQPGRFNLVGTAFGVKSDITKDDGTVMYFLSPDADDDDHYTTTVEWTVPRIYRGHRLKIEVWCQIEDAASSWFIPKDQKNPSSFYAMGTVDMPEAGEASVTLTEPMLATGRDHADEIMFSYSFVVNKINSATLHYTDAVTNKQYTQTLSTSKKVDFAYLPANRPWKDIHIKATVLDVQTKVDNINDRVDIESEKFSSSMLHHPRRLSASLDEKGLVTLNWQVDDPDQGDIYEGDFFEIQRNLTGATDDDDPYWKTISMEVSYENNKKNYSYVDKTLIDQYEGKAVTYRVRRSVSSMWQWINSSTYAQYLMSEIIYLPRIAGATVSRTKQWNDEGHIAKFDLLLSTSDGLVVYNDEDLEAARQKILDGELVQDKIVIPIRNAADWDRCAKAVNEMNIRKPHLLLINDVKLTRDSKMIGDESNPFAGTFYGNGHTLEIDFFNRADYTAPFRYVEGATIKDLHITGRIVSEYKFMGGLIACVYNRSGNPTNIYNCRSSVSIETDYSDDTSSGGFIGRHVYGDLNISYCLFDGRFTFTRGSSNKNHSNGGFIGWKDDTSNRAYIRNCLFAPIEISTGYDNCATFSRAKDLSSVTLVNCYYTQTYGSETNGANDCNGVSAKVLAEWLNDYGVYWEIIDNNVVPVVSEHYQLPVAVWDQRAKLKLRINMHGEKGVESTIVDISNKDDAINQRNFTYELSRKCVDYSFDLLQIRGSSPLSIVGYDKDTLVVHVNKIEGNNTDYSFKNMNRVENLKWEKRQNSVVLTWDTSGGDSDFYRVLRRKHTTQEDAEWTDTIATNLTLQQYEDISTQIQVNYDYCVQSVLQCEGTHITQDICSNAACETTGKIEGYIRLADGTSMGGQTVICEPVDIPGTSSEYKAISDESGYYVFDKLPIYFGPDGRVQGEYHVSVMTSGSGGKYTGPNEQGIVSFNRNANWKQEFNFYMDTYFVYSGNVFYDTSSIPVPGVSFLLDGKLMHDASNQLITTDTQGAFALSIPRGEHSVQAVKDGHTFANKGYLLNPDAREGEDKTRYNFVNNVSSIYIWDSTTVVLRGRVVGGDIEGSRPLGHSLSTNNLGDSLKIVMQLEGDNASYIYRDPKNESLKSTSYTVNFGSAHADTTQVTKTRRSITIRPDAKTGEYELRVHPAKYKITEVSAQGYATLFQNGQVGQTLDLTFNVEGDTCEYNRIYHAIPDVEVTQFNPTGEKYFGVKWLTAQDNIGNKSNVNLVYYTKVTPDAKDSIMHYSFGYPVFMAGSPYGFMLQACEKYYWNNDLTNKVDIVKLDQRGKIIIKNALTTDSKTSQWESGLDEDGGCDYIFTPDNATFTMEGDNALKTFDITLLYDGTYYDVKPFNGNILQGYVMATKAKPEGYKAIVSGKPQLWDILRDPPGGSSTSYIKEGSKLSYGYSIDVTAAAGFGVKTKTGTGADTYHGFVAAPQGAGETTGNLDKSKSKTGIDLKFEFNFGHSWNWTYGMDITERIQTKSGQKWIAGKADLFIGTTESVIVQDAIAVRVVPDSMYQIVKLHEGGTYEAVDNSGQVVTKVKVPVGTTKVLAQGTDNTGKPIYLVRDEVMSMSPTVTSTFVHSQHYIENELLPDLFKIRNSLLLPKGTDVTKAKALADSRGYATYISNVDADDKAFGVDYTVVRPNNETTGDSIKALNQEILTWVGFLAKNEEEKLSVMPNDLVKRYDFDGAANIQYSENFTMGKTMSRYLRYPGLSGLGNLFAATGPLAILMSSLEESLKSKGGMIDTGPLFKYDDDGNCSQVEISCFGSTWEIQWSPILNINANDKYNSSESHSKEVGFTLAASSKSSLTVDVYRTGSEYTIDENTNYFNEITLETLNKVRYGTLTPPMMTFASFTNEKVYSNFVFRTIGGVTCQPYEGERKTKWYQPGTVIDVATIPADKPRIWIEQPVVSNVPFDEPARFVLHMANETDYPERATLKFTYFLEGSSNPNGATINIDGSPLTSAGEEITLWPAIGTDGKHTVFTKEIAVYPSKAFDYENLSVCLMDPEDNARVFTQKFSAHFIPTAGKVKVSVPSNNWVINTESPYDGKRKAWYMPVRIEGFDVNWPNFDHIELQYKLSTQGDNDWVNVCSYYQDRELQKKASGVTDTIPSSGIIVAPFYGEVDPIEQYYDIRAVTFCRHAGGYLTGSSEVLKGIKDTRRPETFGTPEPTNGILGVGDDIRIKFSEPIAGNYLRGINNFEVLGTLLSNDISTSTSLSFDGNAVAGTQGERNLTGKSFTVDVMLNPATDQREMTVFAHGGDEKGLRFGLTADKKLLATINGETLVSDTVVPFNNMLHQVAYVLEQSGDKTTVKFFDGNKVIGSKQLQERYEGASSIILLGSDFDYTRELLYKGEMLEFRLWNRAMSGGELDSYSKKKLAGYETGLLDYYPMNEGEGTWVYDKAPGSMDLLLAGTSWKRPAGISIAIKGDKGLCMNPDKFVRSKNHDFTLTFWFRTNDENATLFSNGEANYGDENQINIGVKDYKLYVRSQGFEKQTSAFVSEGSWHHFAMTVSRSQNVSNVYVDKTLVESFPADSVGGIMGNDITLGATFVDKGKQTNVMKGHIDELGLFESVLPLNLIKEYSNHTPLGTMSALMAYLDFGRSEKLDNNQQHLEPTGISLKRYVDSEGKIEERRDTLLSDEEVKALAARDFYAPMTSNSQMDNLRYSYVANGNELYMNIKEPDFMVEKSNIYVTVKEVPDLQGNLMASPATLILYVYRNPLRWDVKRIDKDVNYGEEVTFEATVKNLSGVKQNFKLEDLPLWIGASQTEGVLDALDEEKITFTVSDYINVGTYNEQIALVGDNKMSEPLPITLRVRGDEPDWAVGDSLKQMNLTMMMVARVKIDGMVASSKEDILAVLDGNHRVLSVAHIEVNDNVNANEALAYLTIYGYQNPDLSPLKLNFLFFDASSGNVYNVKPADGQVYTFKPDAIVGTDVNPVILQNSSDFVQTIKLKKGWNWVSFNMVPKEGTTLGQFMNSMSKWEIEDKIVLIDGVRTQTYTCRSDSLADGGQRWEKENKQITIDPSRMYSIFSKSDKTIYLEGEFAHRYVTVHKNWNRIGYNSTINLPIAQALAGYLEYAQVGDVVKSQDGFAIVVKTATGLAWKGSLQYMEAGKGYMLKRLGNDEVKFWYPIYFNDSRYSSTTERYAPKLSAVNTATTMNVVATVEGVETEAGDKLVVYSGAERMTEAIADHEKNYYLNIGSDDVTDQTLTFVLERDGEAIAMTGSHISYAANKVLGTPDKPTAINFTPLAEIPNDGKWYTLSGVLIGKKPMRSGLYIYNGKVKTIK